MSAEIALEENLTTGYAWEVLSCTGDLAVTDSTHSVDEGARARGMVGAAGTRTFTVTGSAGRVEIGLKRPWEQAPVGTCTFEIEDGVLVGGAPAPDAEAPPSCRCGCHRLGLRSACSECDERHWRAGEYSEVAEGASEDAPSGGEGLGCCFSCAHTDADHEWMTDCRCPHHTRRVGSDQSGRGGDA